MKKLFAVSIIFSLITIALTGDMFAIERKHGVELIIVKKDGEVVRGELIAVKPTSIVTMEAVADLSIDVKDIKLIKIVSRIEKFRWSGIGFIVGGVGGAMIGAAGENPTGVSIGALSVCSGILGLLAGVIGANAGVVETIQIEGKSPEEIGEALQKLNRLARLPRKFHQ